MFDFLFNPNGRISRKGFAIGFFLPWLVLTQVLPLVVPEQYGVEDGNQLYAGVFWTLIRLALALASLFCLWPSFGAVPVKRVHDLGLTGWLQVIVPILGLIGIALIVVGMFNAYDGTPDEFALEFEGIESNAGMYAIFWPLVKASPLALAGLALFFAYVVEFVIFCLIPGQKGPNEHGEDPLASGRGFAD